MDTSFSIKNKFPSTFLRTKLSIQKKALQKYNSYAIVDDLLATGGTANCVANIINNYNKEVFDHFKKHKVEPIIFNFRHRYFWDGGVHCITQDLYREGTQEDYFG